ncbi:hypothetical protein FACS1894189_7070 [Planctomycetales bacterium]|nr:hypothetical protein FACS1894189_7070 [Planctomycetales bacterium]
MSPLKFNSLLVGIIIALVVAMTSSAMALDGMRLWKPYSPESFGGGRRSNDGMYASLSAVYWTISAPDGGYIGATTASGKEDTRWAFSALGNIEQTNSLKINMMGSGSSIGTRLEVGNRRGHHGWQLGVYGLPSQSQSISANNISMAIRDEGNYNIEPFLWELSPANLPDDQVWSVDGRRISVWDRAANALHTPTHTTNSIWQHVQLFNGGLEPIEGIGYLWGMSRLQVSMGKDAEDRTIVGEFVYFYPLPVLFGNAKVTNAAKHSSFELMYTYRPHPFSWGSMELLAGARYWELDDRFGFYGSNNPIESTSTNPTIDDTSGGDEDSGGTSGTTSTTTGFNRVSILSDMNVNARGINRIVGPQIGIKLSRQNSRWTFGLEGRFTAGINSQSISTEGYIASAYDQLDIINLGPFDYDADFPTDQSPIGLKNGPASFGHKKNKVYFSPVLDLRLGADWQWTEAVSFFGAFDTMFADNIVRGSRVTDYVVRSNPVTIFGVRGNDHNTSVLTYGVECGIRVRR